MNGRVLVVDDDADIVALVQTILDEEGYETYAARNGREALAIVGECKPHLILLDLAMPVMSGWEVLKRLSEDGLAAESSIVIMTASHQSVEQIASLPVAGYLPKPFDLEDLIECARRFLDRTPVAAAV